MRMNLNGRLLLILWVLLLGRAGHGQYVIGASVGGMLFELRSRSSGDPHSWANFDPAPGPFWTASIFYRERHFEHTNLGLELIYARKEFNTDYGGGGLGGGSSSEGFVKLDLLHIAIVPQVNLSKSGRSSIRFGVMNGFLLNGSITGRSSSWSIVTGSSSAPLASGTASDFGGDLRLVFGMGFLFPLSGRTLFAFDPYFSPALGSLLKEEPRSKGMEWGLRMGLALRMPGTTISEWMGKIKPAADLGY